ncbi:MAG: hypothetical protein V8R55_04520 [Dysosmobacter sp.]
MTRVKAVFQLTPGTESPAEMNTYFRQTGALDGGKLHRHDAQPLHVARPEVRDANDWARYITQAQTLFSDAEVAFQLYNWPHWGADVVQEYLTNTAAVYKFIHDQTLLYINQGYTATEIAATNELPEALDKVWYTRQYGSSVRWEIAIPCRANWCLHPIQRLWIYLVFSAIG